MGLKDVEGLVAGAGRCGDGTGCEGAVSAPRSLLSDVPMVKAGRGKRGVSIAVGGDVPVLGLKSEVGLGPGCGVLEAADRASIRGGQTHVGAESLISNGVAAGPDMKVGFSHVGEQDVPMVAPPRSDSVFPPISTNYVQIRRGQHAGLVADLLRVVPGHEEVLTSGSRGGQVVEEQPSLLEAGLPLQPLEAPGQLPRVSCRRAEVANGPSTLFATLQGNLPSGDAGIKGHLMELNGANKEVSYMLAGCNSKFESGKMLPSPLTRGNDGLDFFKAHELVAEVGAVRSAGLIGLGPGGGEVGLGVQPTSTSVLKELGLPGGGLLSPIVEGFSTSPSGPSASRSYAAAVHPQVTQAPPLGNQPSSLYYKQPLVENGRVKVVPPVAVAEEGYAAWRSTLVGYFVGKSLPFAVVNSIAHKIWGKLGLVDVLSSESGFFLFRFDSTPQAELVLQRAPWHMASIPLILKLWEPNLTLSPREMNKFPVWVRLFNVPLEYWTVNGLSCVASGVGRPLHADGITLSRKKLSYARVCVEVDATVPLVRSFDLQCANGEWVSVRVGFEWIPFKCQKCSKFGHDSAQCTMGVSSEAGHTKGVKPAKEWVPVSKEPISVGVRGVSSSEGLD